MLDRFFVPCASYDVVVNYGIVNIAIDDLVNVRRSDDKRAGGEGYECRGRGRKVQNTGKEGVISEK